MQHAFFIKLIFEVFIIGQTSENASLQMGGNQEISIINQVNSLRTVYKYQSGDPKSLMIFFLQKRNNFLLSLQYK